MKKKNFFLKIRVFDFRWILSLVLLLFTSIVAIYYLTLDQQSEQTIINQVANRNLTIARSGVLSIEDFFQDRKTEILLLAQSQTIQSLQEQEGRKLFKLFIDNLFDQQIPLADINRVDKNGIIVWSTDTSDSRSNEGTDVNDREYFNWAKNQAQSEEVYISKPLTARGGLLKGEAIINIAVPVYYQELFNGLIFFSFSMPTLTEKYLSPIITSPSALSHLVNQDGSIIASSQSFTDKSAVLGQSTEINALQIDPALQKTLTGSEGSLIHSSPLFTQTLGINDKIITSYSPVKVANNFWSLWISTPYSQALTIIKPLKQKQSLGFSLILIGLAVIGVTFVFGIRLAQRNAFVKGFNQYQLQVKKLKQKEN
ncbi:hypothetical protein A3J78_01785 [Candidatus Beckwithbacteria bacterium RBG_13_35_6]|uniref:Uncharacterized protein n=1 Tax=Candidatus Beckwithbacteria bacterium RBG_13_35_6 TaxID=1797456 RepID=A0A1F5DF20_9BACT|nr:MAG: hypothetical protein A3J78_01785 [Candidatus Beckwithbacteria bacterium RBG_13_35_6]